MFRISSMDWNRWWSLSLQEGSHAFVFLAPEALELKWWRTQSRSCWEPKRQLPTGVSFRELGREAHLFPLPLKRSLRQGGAPRDGEEEVGQPSNQKQFGDPRSGSGTCACRWQWLAPRWNTARNGTPNKTGAHSHDFSLYKGSVPKLHVEPAELYGQMIREPFFECSWLEKTLTLLCYPREEKGAAQNKTVDFSYQMGDWRFTADYPM